MPDVLTRVEKDQHSKARWFEGCEKYGTPLFGSEVNAQLRKGKRLSEAMRLAVQSIEHARLKDSLVEAAKAQYLSRNNEHVSGVAEFNCPKCLDRRAYDKAIHALIAFEAEHKIGEIRSGR